MQRTASDSNSFFGSNNLITGGTFTQQNITVREEGAFRILQRAAAPGAFHDSGERFDPPRCHPNTRTAVLAKIIDWATGKDASSEMARAFVMWLYGPAGAGKSAIAQTIAEMCEKAGIILASFFFSRTDPTRNHAGSLVASILYQIIQHLPQIKDAVLGLIERDPLIFTRSLHVQFTSLLFQPIFTLIDSAALQISPILIVLDGLDECIDPNVQANILDALRTANWQRFQPSRIRFLVASRPELHIAFAFNSRFTDITRLALDDEYCPRRDIFLFLKDKFREIRLTHPYQNMIPPTWPGQSAIDRLVDKSSGQFIYASTVIKFVSSLRHQPTKQLDIVLGLRPVERHMPFAELDALYSYLLSAVEDVTAVLDVLGLVILGIATTTQTLEVILGLEEGSIPILLGDLASLVQCVPRSSFVKTPELSVQIHHASLKDFLVDPSRSKDLHISPPLRHARYAHLGFSYLKIIERGGLATFSSTRDAFRSILHHLKAASMTMELDHDIREFSGEYMQALFSRIGWDDVSDAMEFWCSLIKLLRRLTWDTAAELHDLQLTSFDRFLMENLGQYYPNQFLTFVIAMISANSTKLVKSTLLASKSPLSVAKPLLSAEYEAQKIDKSRLGIILYLYKSSSFPFEENYLGMLQEFLKDTARCQSNKLSGSRYLAAMKYCVNMLPRISVEDAKSIQDEVEATIMKFRSLGDGSATLQDTLRMYEYVRRKAAQRRLDESGPTRIQYAQRKYAKRRLEEKKTYKGTVMGGPVRIQYAQRILDDIMNEDQETLVEFLSELQIELFDNRAP